MWNSPPSARSVAKVCRIGPGSARPLVSISDRGSKCGIVPCSRSATSRRSAFCRSERVLQHRQPLPSSVTSSLLSRSSASSMPTAAEFVDDDRGALPSGVVEEAPHQRGLAGAEESGDDRHRNARAACALLPPAERPPRARETDRALHSPRCREFGELPRPNGRGVDRLRRRTTRRRAAIQIRNPSPGCTARRRGGRRSRRSRARRRTRR